MPFLPPTLFRVICALLLLLAGAPAPAASRAVPYSSGPAGGGGGGGGGGDRSQRWAGPVGATVTLRVAMPTWTEGWLKSGVSWEGTRAPANRTEILGRDIDATSHHVLLMRTQEGIRGPHSWSPAALVLNDAWKDKVYHGPWPKVDDLAGYQAGSAGPSAPGEDPEYRRFSPYVNWSD